MITHMQKQHFKTDKSGPAHQVKQIILLTNKCILLVVYIISYFQYAVSVTL